MRTDLKVPFSEKDEVKNLGARWDSIKKTWYIENGSSLPTRVRQILRKLVFFDLQSLDKSIG